jgi:hypothetical protein
MTESGIDIADGTSFSAPFVENEFSVNQKLKLTSFDIWALGITVVIG